MTKLRKIARPLVRVGVSYRAHNPCGQCRAGIAEMSDLVRAESIVRSSPCGYHRIRFRDRVRAGGPPGASGARDPALRTLRIAATALAVATILGRPDMAMPQSARDRLPGIVGEDDRAPLDPTI
jgi:hypothetical protein